MGNVPVLILVEIFRLNQQHSFSGWEIQLIIIININYSDTLHQTKDKGHTACTLFFELWNFPILQSYQILMTFPISFVY